MKTPDLVALLAANVGPVDRHFMRKRFSWAMLLGGLGSIFLMDLLFGIRPDLSRVVQAPLFWIKLAFPLTLAVRSLGLRPPGAPGCGGR